MPYFKTKYDDYLYVIFRIGIGILFLMLSSMKLLAFIVTLAYGAGKVSLEKIAFKKEFF